jgi:hypothetical protein
VGARDGAAGELAQAASRLFRSLIEIDALLDAAAGLKVPVDAELLLELLEELQREATPRRRSRPPPVSHLMMLNARLMMNTRSYLAYVRTCICDSFEKLNATLNRLRDGF